MINKEFIFQIIIFLIGIATIFSDSLINVGPPIILILNFSIAIICGYNSKIDTSNVLFYEVNFLVGILAGLLIRLCLVIK